VVLSHDLRHGNGEPMTTITTQDGKIVFRDGRVGTGQGCCCDGGGDGGCAESCDAELTATGSIGGMTATVVIPIPGGGSSRFNKPDGSGDYVEVDASIICGTYGPGGALAWAVFVGVCYQSGGVTNGESFAATVPLEPNGCPPAGDVGLACMPFGCASTATGTVG
jgi:hypothetical protein